MIGDIIQRIRNKIARELRKGYRKGVPRQLQTTFEEQDSNWYEHKPLLAGPSTFQRDCSSAETASAVLSLLQQLTPDIFIEFNIQYCRTGLQRFGDRWNYADILTVLYGICKNIKVKSYMEIGVRRGRSLCIVAALHNDVKILGFDLWVPDYVGIENPGPAFVEEELKKVGYKGEVEFITGNSKYTVPKYFGDNPDAYFDLITVDGDHSARGAEIDLKNVIPRVKVGGFLVFDDISNPDHIYLKEVWERVIVGSGRFLTHSFDGLGYGVAFGIKKY